MAIDRDSLREILLECKMLGFSDKQIAHLLKKDEMEIRELRKELNILPVYKMVDTCAAEFEAKTPYFYSCYEQLFYEEQNESIPSKVRRE